MSAAETFTFDDATHKYRLGGRRIVSVTQALESAGLVCYDHINPAVLERKAQIGTAAHAACHYDDDGQLEEASVAPEVVGYLSGWRLFRQETGFVARLIEQRGAHTLPSGMVYGYTLDREGDLFGVATLVEIKCTAGVEISWGPQLAAYELARRDNGKARQRVAVHLLPSGKYRLLRYDDPWDYRVFEWALGLATWKLQKGGGYGYGSHGTDGD